MFRIFFYFSAILLVFSLTSCFKEDVQVQPHKPGSAFSDTVALTTSYKNQVYYNLREKTQVETSLKVSWDLGFESSANGWRVTLNSSCYMKAALLKNGTFGSPSDTTGTTWHFNPSDGSADTVAITRWFKESSTDTIGNNLLYVIDRGLDERGRSRGLRQFIIDSLKNGTYYFRIASFNGTNAHSYQISKKPGVNNVLFSIDKPASEIPEPDNLNWDLLFTQYTTLLFTTAGEPYPYLVTGVVTNTNGVLVAVDSLTGFDKIDYELAQKMKLSVARDRIGYDWKRYDFNSASYTVNPDLVYIIRDTKGFFYKFRFLGFYNNKGEKGYPTFEYQQL